MSDVINGFTEEIRRAAAPARSPGASVPAQTGAQRAATAATDGGLVQGDRFPVQRIYPDREARGPAMQGAANDYGWRVQDRSEIKAYRETYAKRAVEAGGTVVIDPNLATIWRLDCAGNVTVSLLEPEIPERPAFAPEPQFVTSVVIRFLRRSNANITWPAGIKMSKNLKDAVASGDNPLAPPTGASVDQFVLEYWPEDGWLLTLTGWRIS